MVASAAACFAFYFSILPIVFHNTDLNISPFTGTIEREEAVFSNLKCTVKTPEIKMQMKADGFDLSFGSGSELLIDCLSDMSYKDLKGVVRVTADLPANSGMAYQTVVDGRYPCRYSHATLTKDDFTQFAIKSATYVSGDSGLKDVINRIPETGNRYIQNEIVRIKEKVLELIRAQEYLNYSAFVTGSTSVTSFSLGRALHSIVNHIPKFNGVQPSLAYASHTTLGFNFSVKGSDFPSSSKYVVLRSDANLKAVVPESLFLAVGMDFQQLVCTDNGENCTALEGIGLKSMRMSQNAYILTPFISQIVGPIYEKRFADAINKAGRVTSFQQLVQVVSKTLPDGFFSEDTYLNSNAKSMAGMNFNIQHLIDIFINRILQSNAKGPQADKLSFDAGFHTLQNSPGEESSPFTDPVNVRIEGDDQWAPVPPHALMILFPPALFIIGSVLMGYSFYINNYRVPPVYTNGDFVSPKTLMIQDSVVIIGSLICVWMFAYSNTMTMASLYAGDDIRMASYTVWNMAKKVSTGGFHLFWFVFVILTGVIPYVKMILVILCTIILQIPESRTLEAVNFIGKFMFFDTFMLSIMRCAVRVEGIIDFKPNASFYYFNIATIFSIIISNYALEGWRRGTTLREPDCDFEIVSGYHPKNLYVATKEKITSSNEPDEMYNPPLERPPYWTRFWNRLELWYAVPATVIVLAGIIIPCITSCVALKVSVESNFPKLLIDKRYKSQWQLLTAAANPFFIMITIITSVFAPIAFAGTYRSWCFIASFSTTDVFLIACVVAAYELRNPRNTLIENQKLVTMDMELRWPLIIVLISVLVQWILFIKYLSRRSCGKACCCTKRESVEEES